MLNVQKIYRKFEVYMGFGVQDCNILKDFKQIESQSKPDQLHGGPFVAVFWSKFIFSKISITIANINVGRQLDIWKLGIEFLFSAWSGKSGLSLLKNKCNFRTLQLANERSYTYIRCSYLQYHQECKNLTAKFPTISGQALLWLRLIISALLWMQRGLVGG